MKGYGQFCPLAQATQLLCERWTLLVVRELIAGSTRYSELKRGVPQMSPTLLSSRLKQLVDAGVISQEGGRGSCSYELTPAGLELKPVIEILGAWGHRWARSNLHQGDLDASLLMWDMRRSVDAAVFPEQRVVVRFEYPDAPRGGRDWWLVAEKGEIDLCHKDHGYEVDVKIRCSLKTMTSVWICEQCFGDAVRQGDIVVSGKEQYTSKLQEWLRSSPLSRLGTVDALPELNWEMS